MTMQSPTERAAIEALGRVLGPDVLASVYDLYRSEQAALAARRPASVVDAAYGEHPRQVLDLYVPEAPGTPTPILLWVHGGGFLRGEKSSPDHPFGANVGRWAARQGLLGAVMNYRLAPGHMWPAGGDDVAAAVAWLAVHAGRHGGDPSRIILAGSSAGAVNVATFLQRGPAYDAVKGAVLLSGLYGFTPLDERDTLYYGAQALYPERMPKDAVVDSPVPLFVACAEFDPPRFQAETLGLLTLVLERRGRMPRAMIASGHNHFSLAAHLGTADTRLGDEIIAFVRSQCDGVA